MSVFLHAESCEEGSDSFTTNILMTFIKGLSTNGLSIEGLLILCYRCIISDDIFGLKVSL